GIKLLDPEQIDVVDPALLALLVKIVIDLAGAEHHAFDLGVRLELDRLALQKLGIVPKYPVKARARPKLGESRYHALVTEQRLRRHQHKRLAELAVQLAPEHMEIIGGRGAIGDLPIVLGAELEIALDPRRGMLRALALIAMGEQHDEAGHAQPFALAGGEELVDHHLGTIGEIPELRLPQYQRVRLREAVAVLEAE